MGQVTVGHPPGEREADTLPVAYRAYIQRVPPHTPTGKAPPALGCPEDVLVLDTETTTDATQRLVFGSWRFGHRDANGAFICLEEGLIHADDLATTDPHGWRVLTKYVTSHAAHTENPRRRKLLLLSRREFVNDRLWKALEAGALVVGFNLPFDLTRLAIGYGEAKGPMFTGGFVVPLFEYADEDGAWHPNRYRPLFRFKVLDSKRALMGVTKRRGAPVEEQKQPAEALGRFLDLKALVFALTDRNHSLEGAARAFGVEMAKLPVTEHGSLTPAYVDYNRQDVALTVALLEAVLAEWERHPLALSPDKVMSPAGLAKGYLRAMHVTPPRAKYADVPADVLGATMSAYYGGRSEVRVRRVPVPVVYLDFRAMYPTVNALLGLWRLLTAEQLHIADATRDVQQLGSHLTIDQCFTQSLWPSLAFFAKVRPAGDIVPVRAAYNPASDGMSIGVNPLWSDEPVWVAGPDLVASWALTGRWPEVLSAMRLVPVGCEAELAPVALRGVIPVDPKKEDFFRRVIEARAETARRPDLAKEERERLDRFLKVLANSGSYGIFAELNRTPPTEEHGDEVMVYGRNGGFSSRTNAPEDPGAFCFPPFAALTTSAARLMLALLDRLVRDAGGTIAFGDTDSGAIVASRRGGLVACPGGPERLGDGQEAIRALPWPAVERIRQRFDALSPYVQGNEMGSVLKLERQNFAQDGKRQVLYAFAISAKRYALFTKGANGDVTIVTAKEHGLGHLRNPIDPDADNVDWVDAVWLALIREPLGRPLRLPAWVDRPAVSRVSVSTPALLRTFAALNGDKPYAERVKPANFGLSVSVASLGFPVGIDPQRFHLMAAFEKDARRWLTMDWYDKYSGRRFTICVGRDGAPSSVQVKSFRDVILEYRVHPEPKSLGPDGQPCHRGTIGLLARRPVRAGVASYIGKESHRHEEVDQGLVHAIDEVRTTYRDHREDPWVRYALPLLKHLPRHRVAELAGVAERTVQAVRNGREASPATREALLPALTSEARRLLSDARTSPDVRELAEHLSQLVPSVTSLRKAVAPKRNGRRSR